jgi:hypothetical protein
MGRYDKIISKNRPYGNLAVYSPDDVLMFYASHNKMRFYVKNDLAEQIGEREYKLKFVPNGLGYSQENNPFGTKDCLVPRENRCVVSGETDITRLSKHHMVPKFFRKNFPIEFKSSFQTIVLLDRDIHDEYTILEQKYYDELADIYGVPRMSTFNVESVTIRENKLAHSLLTYGHVMPKETQISMEQEFRSRTNVEPTIENLKRYSKLAIVDKKQKTIENDFGMAITAKITDYYEFELMWVNHFIEHMKPKYLPDDLIKKYELEIA